MRAALLIAAKDLRQRLRDRSVLLIAVAAPLGLALVFSGLLANVTAFNARYLVVDLDGGPVAAAFRNDVLGSLETAGVAEIGEAADAAAAQARIEAGEADAAFVLKAGFSAAVTAGGNASIDVLGGARAGLATDVARSVVERFGNGVAGVQLAVETVARLRGAPLTPVEIAAIVEAASNADPPIELVEVTASLRQLSWPTYFSASMAIMFLFLAAQVGITSLFEERRTGTLARMLAGPIRPGTVVLGKAIGGLVTGILAMAILVAATTLVLGANWGAPIGVALLVLAAVLAATGVATLVASFARSAESAGAAASAVGITLAILGGSFTPSAQSPELMVQLGLLTPHAWFLRGLASLHGDGATLADALPAVAILLVMGAITGGVGVARARRLVLAR